MISAKKAYNGIIKEFISTDGQGYIHLNHVCSVAGLGGTPYRDGSFRYYVTEPQRTDDFHYTWEGGAHGEFTFLGHIFRNFGAKTDSLAVAPTVENLKNASVYIIVDIKAIFGLKIL